MITDRHAYARLCEREQWDRLARMSVEESIAVGEALLTSELMALAVFPERERPRSLAIALGIATAPRA
jgi:hypothetical protein